MEEDSKIVTSIISAVVVTAVLVGGVVYGMQRSNINNLQNQIDSLNHTITEISESLNYNANDNTNLDEQNQGAGGSGIPGQEQSSKYCSDQENVPQEEIFGINLTISTDKKTIYLNNKVVIATKDLPNQISVTSSEKFTITNGKFISAVLSPQESLIAFTIDGDVHSWAGIKNVYSGLIYPVSFQFEGKVQKPKWNKEGSFVAFSKTTPEPCENIAVINVTDLKNTVSENEVNIEWTDPTPSGIIMSLKNLFWNANQANRVYFTVASKDTVANNVYGELWYADADKAASWTSDSGTFICSQGKIN